MLATSLRFVVATVFWIPIAVGLSGCETDPFRGFSSDATMIKIFEAHKTDFENLVAMAEADRKLVRIAPDFTSTDSGENLAQEGHNPGFSEERWDEYRRLFAKLELRKGLARYSETDRVYFFAESEGLVTGGAGKGYVYSRTELTPIFSSLEGLDLSSIQGNRAYRRLADNWYLFVDWE